MENSQIKKIIEEIISRLQISIDEIEIVEVEDVGHTKFIIRSNESGLLIGPKGEHFSALNHLIKKIVLKESQSEEPVKFLVDVNDYQEAITNDLKNKARIIADRAIYFKRDVEMEPMTSYQRMLVHSSLSDLPNIKTESTGQGRNRRVVVIYTEEASV